MGTNAVIESGNRSMMISFGMKSTSDSSNWVTERLLQLIIDCSAVLFCCVHYSFSIFYLLNDMQHQYATD